MGLLSKDAINAEGAPNPSPSNSVITLESSSRLVGSLNLSLSPRSWSPVTFQSPAGSSGPSCRICREGDGKEDLVSPCRCTGTVGLVHLTCIERWLSTRSSYDDKCEICHYSFVTIRYPKSVSQWICSDDNVVFDRRGVGWDIMCFFLLTVLNFVTIYLCVETSKRKILEHDNIEAGCLISLVFFLLFVYFGWTSIRIRANVGRYSKWRKFNQNVKLLKVQRISVATTDSLITSQSTQAIVPDQTQALMYGSDTDRYFTDV